MAVTLKPRRTATAGNVPTTANLVDGELAINTTDKKIYVRVGGAIVEVANVYAPKGYIDGLKMEWVSGTSLRVTSGSAYVPSIGAAIELASTVTKAGLSLTANTWYHVYLYLNAGVPDVEIVTTAPAAPYYGSARAKTSDTSRRYVGSVRTDASGNLFNFRHDGNEIYYQSSIFPAPFSVLSGGTATVGTSVSCAAVVPVTSRVGSLIISNMDAVARVDLWNSEASQAVCFVSGNNNNTMKLPLNSSQAMLYAYASSPTSGVNIRVNGYQYER